MQKLLAVEDRIAVAKALHKKVAEKLRKKQKKLADIKEEIVDAKKEFWKIHNYISNLERELSR